MNQRTTGSAVLGILVWGVAACGAVDPGAAGFVEDVATAEGALCTAPLDQTVATLPSSVVLAWPVSGWPAVAGGSPDKIVSPFGPRHISSEGYDFHGGLDLWPASATSEPADHPAIHAAADARVHKKETNANGGLTLVLKHRVDTSGSWTNEDNLYYTRYAHLEDVNGSNGSPIATFDGNGDPTTLVTVTAGTIVGHMGERDATFTHLHFEVRGYNYQFYAVNPLRFLPRSQSDDYEPQILTGLAGTTSCDVSFDPTNPKLWVQYRADPNELDIQKVSVTVTDVCSAGQPSVTKTMDVERKEGITIWEDKQGSDCRIKQTASSYTQYTSDSTKEYFPNYVKPGITPIFANCGALRNHFNWNSAEYSMEVQFDNFGITGTSFRLEADVTDIEGNTVSADPVVPCATSSDCRTVDDYDSCTCEAGASCEASSRGSSSSCSSAPCDQKVAVCDQGRCVIGDP
jgi:hypothetical protein